MSIITHDPQHDTDRHTLPLVTCAAWCEAGDGHPDNVFVTDQACYGPDARTVTAQGDITASLYRPIGSPTCVQVSIETRTQASTLHMSVEAFRAFLTLAAIDVVDAFDAHVGGNR